MNPLVWGPPFWFVMHTVSLNYPLRPTYAQRRTHYDFFYNIRNILPCEMCRQHYRTLLKRFPIEPFLDNRDTLISWVVLIHNQVNVQLGKPTMSREVAMQKYNGTYERQSFCQLPEELVKSNASNVPSTDVVGSSAQAHLRRELAKHKPDSGSSWMVVAWVVMCLAIVVCLVGCWSGGCGWFSTRLNSLAR